MSPKQRAEWIVTHPVLQRMAKLMENMFVEDKNVILGNDCHSTTANSTDSISRNTKRKRRGRKGGQLMLISYCVRLIVMTTPLHCYKNVYSHNCLEIGTKLVKSFICSLPQGLYVSIKTKLVSLEVLENGVKLGELTAYDMDSSFNCTILIGQKLLVVHDLSMSCLLY